MKADKIFKLAKGFRGRAKNTIRIARNRVEKALQYAYRDRKAKKRDFRGLWIQQINAGTREHGIGYSEFISGLKDENIQLNRKMLADLAQNEPYSFKALVHSVQSTTPKSRIRRRHARACRLLAEFQGETAENCRHISEMGAGYGLRRLDTRVIPNDPELLQVVEAVPERFRWMFRCLFLYGCRPHEIYGAERNGFI